MSTSIYLDVMLDDKVKEVSKLYREEHSPIALFVVPFQCYPRGFGTEQQHCNKQ